MIKFSLLTVVLLALYFSAGYSALTEEENKDISVAALTDANPTKINNVLLVRNIREAVKKNGRKNQQKKVKKQRKGKKDGKLKKQKKGSRKARKGKKDGKLKKQKKGSRKGRKGKKDGKLKKQKKNRKKARKGKKDGKLKKQKKNRKARKGKKERKLKKQKKNRKKAKKGKKDGKLKKQKKSRKARKGKNGGKLKKQKKNRKARKGKKDGKRKKQKKSRKARKGRKDGKPKKQKKSGRGKEKKSIRTNNRQVSATCVSDLADLGAFYGNQARNFFRQASRSVTKSNQVKGKKNKNKDFEEPQKIVNSSSSGCSGNTTVAGVITMLGNCSTSINSECGGAFSDAALAEAEKCKTSAEAFRTAFLKATTGNITPAPDTICGALADLKTLKATAITDCKNSKSGDAEMVAAKKKCDKSFQACRKAERDTIPIMNTCAPSCVTTGSGQTTSAFMGSMGRYYF